MRKWIHLPMEQDFHRSDDLGSLSSDSLQWCVSEERPEERKVLDFGPTECGEGFLWMAVSCKRYYLAAAWLGDHTLHLGSFSALCCDFG